jgi:hypothetical protein
MDASLGAVQNRVKRSDWGQLHDESQKVCAERRFGCTKREGQQR